MIPVYKELTTGWALRKKKKKEKKKGKKRKKKNPQVLDEILRYCWSS